MCRRIFIILILASLLLSVNAHADDSYKPYLHKASVPEHPQIKLFGQYSTNLYPGAASYSYSIEVPKGVNNLQPVLTISYNSQAVNQRPGILGASWSLTESYIYRNVNFTPNDESDDRFILVLEGIPYELIKAGELYHTEVEYNFKIKNLSGGSDNHGMYWLVTKKDGTVYRFGYNADSELYSNMGRNHTARWNLDQIEDTFGNKISYSYLEDPEPEDKGTAYLKEILYNNDQKRKIQFNYESSARPDRRLVFEQGNKLDESRRLTDISIFADESLVRRYHISYIILNPALSSVSEITQYGSDNVSSLHSVSFEYYTSGEGFTKSSSLWKPPVLFSNNNHVDFGVRLVDINNDGFADMVKGRAFTSEKKTWLNDKKNNFNETSSFVLPDYVVAGEYGLDAGMRFVDLNNDGFTDIVKARSGARKVYINNGTGWADKSTEWNFPIDIVDNDGKDLGVIVIDVDGDNKADILKSNTGGTKKVYINNGKGWTDKTSDWNIPVYFINNSADTGARITDLNGDGLPDIIRSSSSGAAAKEVWLNNGKGWTDYSSVWNPSLYFITNSKPDDGVRFADVNNDGLIDMLEDYANGSVTNRSAWINSGYGWSSDSDWKSPEAFTKDGHNIARRIADVNGDGFTDVVVSHQDSTQQYVWIKDATLPYILKKVTNEYGGVTLINYTKSTVLNNSEKGLSNLGFNLFVVRDIITNNSMGLSFDVSSSTDYNYSFGKYNYENFEFRGFGLSTEKKPDSVVKHYFYQDDPRRGKEYRTETYDTNDKIYSKTLKDFNYTRDFNGIYNLSLLFSASYLYDGSDEPKITNTSYIYDRHGNPLLVSEQGDVFVTGDEKYTSYSYAYNKNDWIMDRVAEVSVFDSDNQKVKDTKYYYDDLGLEGSSYKGALTKKEEWNNNGNNSFTYFDYDDFGNVISQTDSLGNVMKYTYDSTNTYPEKTINALGQITQFSYDLGTGNLLWKEANDIKTEYKYDVFGRISKEIQPYDTSFLPTKSYSYSFDGIAPESIAVSQKTSTNKTNVVRFFYDGFTNLVQLKTDVENGHQIVKNIHYDGFGKVIAEDNPYFGNYSASVSTPLEDIPETGYSYDVLDRVVLVTNPDSTNKTIVFDRKNITDYDENGNRHLYELDSFGRIAKVHEYNSDPVAEVYGEEYVTDYGYDALNNLIKITDNEGNVFTFTYDSLGRKIKMIDPDMGTWNYQYDQNNNLISQSGGGGNLVTGDNYYREYNGDNQLIRVRNGSTSSSPILEEYTYDPYGQRIKIIRYDSANTIIYTPFKEFMRITNSSGTYDYTYVYDGNNLISRINPDGTKLFFHNDHLGSATSITNQNRNITETVSYSPFGEELTDGSDIHGYTGQQDDELTNQMYYGARYYKPQNTQFIQADTLIKNRYNPQNLNRYSYAMNNPYKYVDPTGNFVVYAGNYGEVGFGTGVSASTGIVVCIFCNEGAFTLRPYTREGVGLVTPTLEGGFEFGVAPFQNSFSDFEGDSYDFNADVGEVESLGIAISVPEENKEGKKTLKSSKFSFGMTYGYLDLNPPILPFSASTTKSSIQTYTNTKNVIDEADSATKTTIEKYSPTSDDINKRSSKAPSIDKPGSIGRVQGTWL